MSFAPLEVLRLSLRDLALCGYLFLFVRLILSRTPYPFFGMMLAADFFNVLLVSPTNVEWMTFSESVVVLTRVAAWGEAIAWSTYWLAINRHEREYAVLMALCIGVLCASLTAGLYGSEDQLALIKNLRLAVHSGCLVAGTALLLYCHLYSVPQFDRDRIHLNLLLVWYGAVTMALLSYPQAGQLVKWQWVNIGYRIAVIACLFGWERLTAASAASPSGRGRDLLVVDLGEDPHPEH